MKIDRSRCVVFPLVLKGEWYKMIASGEKREALEVMAGAVAISYIVKGGAK